jgi:hypothetical protein
LLCRKRKPRKNTTKNWIPKELRTSTSQPSGPNEDVEAVGDAEATQDAETVVTDHGAVVVRVPAEDAAVVRVPAEDAAVVCLQTPPSSPPTSVKWLVKKITPRKNLKRAAQSP